MLLRSLEQLKLWKRKRNCHRKSRFLKFSCEASYFIEMLNFKKSKMYSQYLGMCYWLCWETSNQVIWFWLSCEWDIQLTDFLQFTHIASNTIRSFSSYEHFVLHLYLCLCKHTFMHNLNGLILTGSKDFFGWIDRFDIN